MSKYMRPPDYCTAVEFDGVMEASFENIERACAKANKINDALLLKMFKGIRVVVDPKLDGKSYYVAVSQELFDFLDGMQNENTNQPDKDRT